MVTAAAELRRNWVMLFASWAGCCLVLIPPYVTSVLMGSWAAEFAWERSAIAIALSFFSIALVSSSPFYGMLVDRFGARNVAAPCLILLSAVLAGVGLFLTPNIWSLYLAYAAIGLVGAGSSPVVFSKSIIRYFFKARGLALGIAVSGTAITGILAPFITYAITKEWGWRGAWFFFAALPVVLIPLVLIGIPSDSVVKERSDAPSAVGTRFITAVRGRVFWLLAIAFFLTTTVVSGALGHMVPILQEAGTSTQKAVLIQSSLAVGLLVGRVCCGALADRFFAPRIYQVVALTAAVGFLILFAHQTHLAIVAGICIGLATGAEYDLIAYLSATYFGPRDYGKIYGSLFGCASAGGILAPFLIGHLLDRAGDYSLFLIVAATLLTISAILFQFLGPYPQVKNTVDGDFWDGRSTNRKVVGENQNRELTSCPTTVNLTRVSNRSV